MAVASDADDPAGIRAGGSRADPGGAARTGGDHHRAVRRSVRAAVVARGAKRRSSCLAGDPSVALTGVAVTVAARLEHLRRPPPRAAISSLPRNPCSTAPTTNPAIALRMRCIWRRRPTSTRRSWSSGDSPITGTRASPIRALRRWPRRWLEGWPGGDHIYPIPEISLSSLAAHVSKRLGLGGGMRTIGPPDMRVRTVLLSPGTTDLASTVARLNRVDVVLAGEPREWKSSRRARRTGGRRSQGTHLGRANRFGGAGCAPAPPGFARSCLACGRSAACQRPVLERRIMTAQDIVTRIQQ